MRTFIVLISLSVLTVGCVDYRERIGPFTVKPGCECSGVLEHDNQFAVGHKWHMVGVFCKPSKLDNRDGSVSERSCGNY